MGMRILKVECEGLTLFEDGKLTVDFIGSKSTTAEQLEDNTVERLFNTVDRLNTVTFLGVNASGKTTAMNILSDILLVFLGNKGLDHAKHLSSNFEDKLFVRTYYYNCRKKEILKLESEIRKLDDFSLYFENESLYKTNSISKVNRSNIFAMSGDEKVMSREKLDAVFLKKEDSIFSSEMNEHDHNGKLVLNLTPLTNQRNSLIDIPQAREVMRYASYLDPSIEYLEPVISENDDSKINKRYKLKFINQDKEYLLNSSEFQNYLSAGTIKGISLFLFIQPTLKYGGYVFIDEIENHFNKVIVQHIIKLFLSDLNKSSATLIFSTHYSELVDVIDRTDSIYLMKKMHKITINKYSEVGKQYDKPDRKKSNVILSGVLGTAPSYKAYMRLKKDLRKVIKEDSNE